MEEKDLLQIIKERFEKEGVVGDKSEAARRVKVSTPNVANGLAKEKFSDLTKSEKKAIISLRKVLDERKMEEEEALNAELNR